MDFKLLAVDIDGTLVSSQYTLTKSVKRALAEIKNKGVFLTLATGRFYGSASAIAKEVGINVPMIANDGAQIQDVYTGELIHFRPLDIEIAREIVKVLGDYPLELQVFLKNCKIFGGRNYRMVQLKKFLRRRRILNFRGVYNYLRDFAAGPVISAGSNIGVLKYITEPPVKLVLSGKSEVMEEFRQVLEERFSGMVSTTSAIKNYMDILAPGVSKAYGLEILTRYLDISRNQIVAVGDNYNDLEMIEYAGLGVAMGNAPDAVKEKADFITDSNDNDGLVKVISVFFNGISGTKLKSAGIEHSI